MDHFAYRDRTLFCEDVPVPELAATYGTPLYVYSRATLLHHLREIQTAFAPANPIICYSVKTNGNLSLCQLMAEHGSGFDVTSGGEGLLTCTRDDDAANLLLAIKRFQRVNEFIDKLKVQGIALLWSIQGDDANVLVALNDNVYIT